MYDNGRTNIDVYYDSAKWHADNWGLGFVPFYGTGFNVNFKNNMGNAVRGIETYIETFLNENSANFEKFNEMQSNLEGLRDQVLAIDPLSDEWVSDLLEETGLGEEASDLISATMLALVEKGVGNLGPVGTVVKSVMSFIGGGFQAKKLSDAFKEGLVKKYIEIQPILSENDEAIRDAHNKVLQTQKQMSKKFDANTKQQTELRKELEENLKEIEERNKELENLKQNIVEAKSKLVKTMNQGIFADNYYYWQMNIISDVSFVKNNLKTEKESIEEVNNLKNMLYKELVETINNNLPNSEILSRLEEKNTLSNNNYKYIQSI